MDDDTKKKKKVKLFETFTKAWVSMLMIIAVLDLQLSYLLAYLGKEQIAETLSVSIVTEIIGVMGIYLIRAFLESATIEKQKLQKERMNLEFNNEENPPLEEDISNQCEG